MSYPDHALAAWSGADMIQQAIGLRKANFNAQSPVTGHRVTSNVLYAPILAKKPPFFNRENVFRRMKSSETTVPA